MPQLAVTRAPQGKREVRRRGWGTATTPFNHVASDRATAGGGRGTSRGRSGPRNVGPSMGLASYVGGNDANTRNAPLDPRYGSPVNPGAGNRTRTGVPV